MTYKYKGCLYLKCPVCGQEKAFIPKEEISGYHCSACGADTAFTEPLRSLWLNCECGKRNHYMTNMKEKVFDVECIQCKAPVAVEWNNKKRLYETVR